MPKTYTKESLIKALQNIRNMGWIENARHGNDGGVGNTLEDLLGIEENNLPIPNASEWELKCQRGNSSSLTTLFHSEPSPRAMKFVPSLLLPNYGWKHEKAGDKYPEAEMSFRQTINAQTRTDRGFGIVVNRQECKVAVSFLSSAVGARHSEWLESVKDRIGLAEMEPQPYWGFDDIFHCAGVKLLNCFYVRADVEKRDGKEFFHYSKIIKLQKFSLYKLVAAIEEGSVLIDFDARTGHNHGTKFRLKQNCIHDLYEAVEEL